MYKQDLALNKPQGLICHKTKANRKVSEKAIVSSKICPAVNHLQNNSQHNSTVS